MKHAGLSLLVFALAVAPVRAQQPDVQARPEETEIWQPLPSVVTPGPPSGIGRPEPVNDNGTLYGIN